MLEIKTISLNQILPETSSSLVRRANKYPIGKAKAKIIRLKIVFNIL